MIDLALHNEYTSCFHTGTHIFSITFVLELKYVLNIVHYIFATQSMHKLDFRWLTIIKPDFAECMRNPPYR